MGYTTDFNGEFSLNKPLLKEHADYLNSFASTRRMKRDENIVNGSAFRIALADPVRVAAGLPGGNEGAYFVGGTGHFGQDEDASVLSHNSPPNGQPGLWCQWVPYHDGTAILWDGGEKFYNYVEWIEYLIEHFLAPWGYELNGEVYWFGEDRDDNGVICIEKNVVKTKAGKIMYDEVA
jgi:hypothetical protein